MSSSTLDINKCQLCGKKVSKLTKSHIIPSFVGKWLKETSVTGYLRQRENANVRIQDLVKQKLLCSDCEIALSVNEKLFAENIFIPYVAEELDEWAIAKGKIKSFSHTEWLIKFIIGLQWKTLVTNTDLDEITFIDEITKNTYRYKITSILKLWKEYLLGQSKYLGSASHYVIFLQNLIAGAGYLPERISNKVNMYLIRSVDSTLAISRSSLYLYTKLGPIVILSALKPSKLHGIGNAIVKKKGSLKTAQILKNSDVNEFIFITRPNEAFSGYSLSEKQKKVIDIDTRRKLGTAKSLQVVNVARSDVLLRERRGKNKISELK